MEGPLSGDSKTESEDFVVTGVSDEGRGPPTDLWGFSPYPSTVLVDRRIIIYGQ